MNTVKGFLREASRKALLLAVLLLSFSLRGAEPLTVQVSLDDVATAGVELPVSITVNAKLSADDVTLPEIPGGKRLTGIVSCGFSARYDSRSGSSVSTTMSFIILPEREGEFVIPPVKVRDGRRQGESAPYRFKVYPAGAPVRTAEGREFEAPRGELEILPHRRLYAGETATLVLHLAIPDNLRVRSMPRPEVSGLGDVSFITGRSGNRDETFRISFPRRDGSGFTRYDCIADFRILEAGKYTPSAAMILNISVPQKRRSFFDDDDFFAPFSAGRTVQRKVLFPAKAPVEVLPLPPAPVGACDLALIGSWKTSCRTSAPSAKTGEAVELILSASGAGGSENFRAPQLEFPGFRVYPPEVRRENGTVSARYVMIPLKAGKARLNFAVSVFDAEKGKYEVNPFDLTLPVAQGSAVLPPSTTTALPPRSAPAGENVSATETPLVRDGLNYQKPGAGSLVAVPLIVNGAAWITLLLAAAFAMLLLTWLLPRLRRGDPERAARRELRRKLRELRRAVKEGDPAKACRQYGVSAIAEALGLAPGATASEIAGKCRDDADLHRFFTDLDASGFIPGGGGSPVAEKEQSRRALLKLLARIMPLLLFALPALGAEEINGEFNAGNYDAAIKRYLAMTHENSAALSPAVLYNLGNAYCRAGDLPRARVELERAQLLAPRDPEIRANAAWVRNELQLSSAGTGRIAALRDRFRPDEYLVFAAAAVALLALLTVLRCRIPAPALAALTGILLLALILSLCAAVAQAQGSYSPTRAVLIGKSVEVRSMPATSGGVVSRAAGGSDAAIIEKRGAWMRIHTAVGDGWVPAENVAEIFPYGIF